MWLSSYSVIFDEVCTNVGLLITVHVSGHVFTYHLSSLLLAFIIERKLPLLMEVVAN